MQTDEQIQSDFFSIIKKITEIKNVEITSESKLIGVNGLFDSMGLVELCVNLEEKANELGFEFDWTSDKAMSRSSGFFSSVGTLFEEFMNQLKQKK